jgi:thioredoxin-like negative regulator of GroEL
MPDSGDTSGVTLDPVAVERPTSAERPRLIFFYSQASGRSRRVEGYLSQVLQRRHNHESFRMYRVDIEAEPELVQRFGIDEVPTLVVVDGKRVSARLTSPRGCHQIEDLLAPWLR